MTIRAVFFDLDDTLCQTSASRLPRARLAHELLTSAGHDIDFDLLLESVLKAADGTSFPRGMRPALEELGLFDSEAGRRAAALWFFEGAEHLVEGFAGHLETLHSLSRRYRLGVITNGPIDVQSRKFAALELGAHFHADLFVTSEHAGCFKPDPTIFRYALARARLEPHEAIHIGDVPQIDVAGAQAAGMRAIWFNPAMLPAPEGIVPDATVRSYAELPSALALLEQQTQQ